jgi:hypothetical protein
LNEKSGNIRDIIKNGMKTRADDAEPRKSTGNTALWFSAVFLNIS